MRGVPFGLLALLWCLSSSVTRAETLNQIEIDEIQILGVTAFESQEIEAILEIQPGDVFNRKALAQNAENLQVFYSVHGYESARVQAEMRRQRSKEGNYETLLIFKITEGEPTRVSAIQFTPEKVSDEMLKRHWQSIEKDLASRLGLKAGDVFDQEKIALGKAGLLEVLAGEEFVGAKVDDVRVMRANDHRVSLDFHIDLGDRVSFGLRGNQLLSKGRLAAIVDEQRLLGFGSDYINAIKVRIEDEYRASGYDQVRVTPFTFENPSRQERHVTYAIQEGKRVQIATIEFEGNSVFTDESLRERFYKSASRIVQGNYFVDKDVEKATLHLIEWMKSQGYLAAKWITTGKSYSKQLDQVTLTIYLYEGDQTFVQAVSIDGMKAFTMSEAKQILMVEERAPINLFAFNEGIEALKQAYRSKGYLNARVANEGSDSVIEYSQENHLADINLELIEGPQFRAGRIEVEGLTTTQEYVVRRELLFHQDDVLEESLISGSESRIRKLGIFGSVSIRVFDDPERASYKLVKVIVQEGTPGVVGGGIGYRNDLGVRVFGQTAYANLWRKNHTVSLALTANQRLFDSEFCKTPNTKNIFGKSCFLEYQGALGYIWPWFVFGDTSYLPRFTVEKTQFRKLDKTSIAITNTLERRLLRNLNLTGLITHSIERVRQFNAPLEPDNRTLLIGSIIPALRLDLRDNSLAPTRGLFASTSFEWADPLFLSQKEPFPVGFTRFQFRSDYTVPLAEEMSWYFSFRSGIERSTQVPQTAGSKDSQIPLSKVFTLGGAGSLRGFKEEELNVGDKAILGTLSYVNYRTQVDFPFAGPMRFGPFLDAANLTIDHFSFGNLRYGTGVGFHYQSPVGPVNFDWGFKIDPRLGEDTNRFYFSIGII